MPSVVSAVGHILRGSIGYAGPGQSGAGLLDRRGRHGRVEAQAAAVVAAAAVGRLGVVELLSQEAHPAAAGVEVVEHRGLLALPGLADPLVALGVVGPRLAGGLPPAAHPADGAVDVEHLEHGLEPVAAELDPGLEGGRAQHALGRQRLERLAHQLLAWERQRGEVGPDVAVLGRGQQHHGGLVGAAAGAADLLVVGDRRLRRPHVDHEAERRVEPHAERAGGDQRLDPAGGEVLLEDGALGGLGLAGVGSDVVAAGAEVAGDLLGGRHGEAVDDADARLLGEVVGEPGQPSARRS